MMSYGKEKKGRNHDDFHFSSLSSCVDTDAIYWERKTKK